MENMNNNSYHTPPRPLYLRGGVIPLAINRFHFAFVLLVFFALAFKLKLAVEFVPIIVVGSYACLVHQADGGGSLIDGIRLSGVVVLALAPGAAACHLAVQAFLRTLSSAVEGEERSQLVFIYAVAHIANDDWFLLT